MTPKRMVLAGLCAALVTAGVVLAIVNLSAADQVASVASFVLAAILAGMAISDRRSSPHSDRSENPPATAPPSSTAPGASDGGNIIVGPGGRAAIDCGVAFNDKVRKAKVTINHGTERRRWWPRRGVSVTRNGR